MPWVIGKLVWHITGTNSLNYGSWGGWGKYRRCRMMDSNHWILQDAASLKKEEGSVVDNSFAYSQPEKKV